MLLTSASDCVSGKVALKAVEGILIENHPTWGKDARVEVSMQCDGIPRHFSTLHWMYAMRRYTSSFLNFTPNVCNATVCLVISQLYTECMQCDGTPRYFSTLHRMYAMRRYVSSFLNFSPNACNATICLVISQRYTECMQCDGMPRHFSTVHRIEDKILQLEILAVMSNIHNSKTYFNKKKQLDLWADEINSLHFS
jgi:hypothetical protein